jgi:hypothetical protein
VVCVSKKDTYTKFTSQERVLRLLFAKINQAQVCALPCMHDIIEMYFRRKKSNWPPPVPLKDIAWILPQHHLCTRPFELAQLRLMGAGQEHLYCQKWNNYIRRPGKRSKKHSSRAFSHS